MSCFPSLYVKFLPFSQYLSLLLETQLFFLFLKLITPLLLHLFTLSRSPLSFKSCLSVFASHSLMPLSQIFISFPLVSLVFVDLTTRRRNCFISDVVLRNFDNCRLTSIVALDFTKAFDTVNHDLLLVKLKLCSHSIQLSR